MGIGPSPDVVNRYPQGGVAPSIERDQGYTVPLDAGGY